MRLLIAEDEADLAEALTAFFEKTSLPWIPSTMALMPMNTVAAGNMMPSSWM
jgi:hypothetical protein